MEGKSKRIPFVKLETNKYKMYEAKIKSNKITIRRSPLVINYIRVIFDNLRNLNSLFICVWCCSQMFYEGVLMLVLVQNVRQAAKEMFFFFLSFIMFYVTICTSKHSLALSNDFWFVNSLFHLPMVLLMPFVCYYFYASFN